jgi:tRNA(Leu) C34 or U34 (ribose-2'-O)-methylase TrmL
MSARCFGAQKRPACTASAGAVEHLLLAPVDDLPSALSDLHARGVRIIGSDGDAPLTARQTDLRGPIAIIVGSEGQGLGPAVRRRADAFMRIPMKGAVGSLNAAVAGSILLFEALAQREPAMGPTPGLTSTSQEADLSEAEPPDAPLPGAAPSDAAPPDGEPVATEGSKKRTRRVAKAGPDVAAATSAEDDLLPAEAAPKRPARRAPRKTAAGGDAPPDDPGHA